MSLFLKFVIAVVLLALMAAGVLSVLRALVLRVSPESFPRMRDLEDGEDENDEHESGSLLEFRDAMNPSMKVTGETPVSHGAELPVAQSACAVN
jgi:hypothetical protein